MELQKLGRRELIEMILSNNAFILQHLLNGRSDSYSDVLMQQIVYNAYTAHVQGYSIIEDDEVFYFWRCFGYTCFCFVRESAEYTECWYYYIE